MDVMKISMSDLSCDKVCQKCNIAASCFFGLEGESLHACGVIERKRERERERDREREETKRIK